MYTYMSLHSYVCTNIYERKDHGGIRCRILHIYIYMSLSFYTYKHIWEARSCWHSTSTSIYQYVTSPFYVYKHICAGGLWKLSPPSSNMHMSLSSYVYTQTRGIIVKVFVVDIIYTRMSVHLKIRSLRSVSSARSTAGGVRLFISRAVQI